MRVLGALVGLGLMWMGIAVGDKSAIVGGILLGGALVLACMPKGFRRAALVLGAVVVVVCTYAAWAG